MTSESFLAFSGDLIANAKYDENSLELMVYTCDGYSFSYCAHSERPFERLDVKTLQKLRSGCERVWVWSDYTSSALVMLGVDPKKIYQMKSIVPGKFEIELYAARMHAEDLGFAGLSRSLVDIYREIIPAISARDGLSKMYEVDVRSSSDSGLAETVLKNACTFKCKAKNPDFVQYRPWQSAHLTTQPVLIEKLSKLKFKIGSSGRPELPEDFESSVVIGDRKYTIGMGGLHSVDECRTIYATHDKIIKEIDVDSFYPSIMLNCGYIPRNFDRSEFYDALKKMASDRYMMKISGDEAASALKIVLNGIFGRLGYEHSDMQDVDALLHITITGQIQLLMLIEALTSIGCDVLTANTDGIVISSSAEVDARCVAVVNRWCRITGHGVKTTKLKMIHIKSMNNYISVDDRGDVKRKGAFAVKGSALNSTLTKNRSGDIIANSATDAILSGHNVCIDISKVNKRDFVFCGIDDGVVKRWYFDKSGLKYINKLSEVDTLNIDIDYYVKKAEKLISRKLDKLF